MPPQDTKQTGAVDAPPQRGRLTCPHCLESAEFGNLLYISQHEQLRGDPILGDEADCRFLPSRFDLKGRAIDAFGFHSDRLACPHCRLEIDRSLINSTVAFFSLIGAPSSGKSNLLGALTWELRRQMSKHFNVVFTDIDPVANRILNRYEESLFHQDDDEALVALPKTTKAGDLYRSIMVGAQPITLPKPFLFSMRTDDGHPTPGKSFVVVLYDNAGEHFYPGEESLMTQATKHLGKSSVLMFLFDPLQDPQFRKRVREMSSDPQLQRPVKSEVRQETILLEATTRVRRSLGLELTDKHRSPLIVVVTKCDVWGELLGIFGADPWVPSNDGGPAHFEVTRVERMSDRLRELLVETTPDLVTTAESFAEKVLYVPASALGTSPVATDDGGLAVRAGSIQPCWASVPLLYALTKWSKGLITRARASANA